MFFFLLFLGQIFSIFFIYFSFDCMFALSYTFRRSLSGVRYGSVELGEKKEQKWSLPVIPIFFIFVLLHTTMLPVVTAVTGVLF